MALLKPSLTLVLDLDERLAGHDTVLEIKRCYTYVGAPVVRTHAAGPDDPVRNTARMLVGLGTRKYLHSADEGADELWETVVEHWVGNMLYKIGHTMKAFNKRQREIGLPEVVFDRFDVELGGGALVVSLHPDPESFVDDGLAAQVGLARTLLNDGTIAGAVRIEAPSDDAYETQRALAWEAWLAEHPEPGQADGADGTGSEADDADADGAGTVDGEPDGQESYEEWLERDRVAKSYENTAVPPTDSDALPAPKGAPEKADEAPEERFDFAVDYTIWSVTFADGSTRPFDAAERRFID